MSETTMLTIKTNLDDSGLKKLETRVAASLEVAHKLVEQFNKTNALVIDTDAFIKDIQKIEQALKSIRRQSSNIELMVNASGFTKELDGIEAQLNSIERDYLCTVKVNADELRKAETLAASLNTRPADEHTKNTIDSKKTLETLEKEYKVAESLSKQLYDSKERHEAGFASTHKEYLEDRLRLLKSAAADEIKDGKKVSDELKKSIHEVEAELEKAKEAGISMKDVSDVMTKLSGRLTTLSGNINTFYAQGIDSRIKSLEKSHKRELKELEEHLAAEMAMYDEQLEQYSNLQKDKEDLTEEHNERLEELNEKMQDHLTEEQWRVLQEQMEEETLRYEESMAALEADTIARDELQAQKEQAEAAAMARKEQMEKEYAIRKAKLERKKAEGDKANSMFAAVINTAQGISLAWAQGGGLFGAFLAALVAAAGAIQIATIAARPLPEIPSYHSGGTIGADNIHHYRYLPGPDNPYDKTLFWGQKGEEVLNLHESEAYRALRAQGWSMADIMESRLAASYSAGGAHIDNSKHVAQNLTIQARNELTFSEARRLARRQNRAMVRALA